MNQFRFIQFLSMVIRYYIYNLIYKDEGVCLPVGKRTPFFDGLRKEQHMEISKVEIITSMNKVSGLKSALSKVGVTGMTVLQAIGCGVQKGTYEYEPERREEMELLPKQYIMIVVENSILNKVLDVIKKELYTGHIGDGKIFVSPISNVIRIRTGEEGFKAIE